MIPLTTSTLDFTLPSLSLLVAAWSYGLGGIVAEDSQVAWPVCSYWWYCGDLGCLPHTKGNEN